MACLSLVQSHLVDIVYTEALLQPCIHFPSWCTRSNLRYENNLDQKRRLIISSHSPSFQQKNVLLEKVEQQSHVYATT